MSRARARVKAKGFQSGRERGKGREGRTEIVRPTRFLSHGIALQATHIPDTLLHHMSSCCFPSLLVWFCHFSRYLIDRPRLAAMVAFVA